MKNLILTISLTLLTTLAGLASTAFPQTDIIEHIQGELEITDRLILEAKEAVHASQNPLAAFKLKKAFEIQQMAWQAFRSQTRVGYENAAILTRKARELAKSALSLSRQSEQHEAVVLRHLERASETLGRAWKMVEEGGAGGHQSVLESARVNLHRAWEFFQNGNYRPAVKLADQVEKAARRMLRALGGEFSHELQFSRRLDNVRQLVGEIRSLVADCGSGAAGQYLERAVGLLQHAEELRDQRIWGPGLETLNEARKLALKASHECQDTGHLGERLERMRAESERLADRILALDDNRREAARKLIKQVSEQLHLASGFIEEDHLTAAEAALRGAELTLRQLKRFLSLGK